MKTIMKHSLILTIITLFFLFSCLNPQKSNVQKSNQTDSRIKDSIYWAEKGAKAILYADSVFTGFMDLKWNSSKKEAIKFLRLQKNLKLILLPMMVALYILKVLL